jgi:hypothetical protein
VDVAEATPLDTNSSEYKSALQEIEQVQRAMNTSLLSDLRHKANHS